MKPRHKPQYAQYTWVCHAETYRMSFAWGLGFVLVWEGVHAT